MDEIISSKNQKMPYIIKWLIYEYKKIFKVFTIKPVSGNDVIIIPRYKNNEKTVKIIPDLVNILYDRNCDTIVLSNSLKNINGVKECINKENIKILDGTFLKENLLLEIVIYVANSMNISAKDVDVTILANDNKFDYMKNIINIAENIKNIKIITNNVERFKNVEQKIQELLGILIRITNNKRKGLANSQIIINLDFPEELINKYAINPEAIIVNIGQNVKIKSKKFKGINANNIKISMKTNYNTEFEQNKIFNDFEEAELYEASIKNMSFEEIKKKFQKDNVNVTSLIGNNGSINKKEFEEKCKFYVKSIDKMLILN